jgi:hypothetical protein
MVNYAIKKNYALAIIDSVPGLHAKLPPPVENQKSGNPINRVEENTVMILN